MAYGNVALGRGGVVTLQCTINFDPLSNTIKTGKHSKDSDTLSATINFDPLSNTSKTGKHSKDSDTLSATINFLNFSTVSIQA